MPNIENAWTYICQSESRKALQLAISQFKSVLDSKMALPCSTPDLQNDYKNAKKEALKVYRQRAIESESKGENSVALECRKIYDMVKIRNDEICTAACTDFLNQYHSEIMMSLNAQGSASSSVFTTLD